MPDYDGAYGRLTAWLLQSYEDRHIEVEHGATEEWLEEPTDHFEENVGWVIDSPGVRMQSGPHGRGRPRLLDTRRGVRHRHRQLSR
jgi:hypothetical protein